MFRRKEEELENQEQETANKPEEKKEPASASAPAAATGSNQNSPANAAPQAKPASAPAEAKVAPMAQPASAYRPAPATPPRPAAAPVNPAASNANAPQEEKKRRVLTVGNDILLKGEIATCDRLVIEGAVDAKLNEVHTVEIAETGSFKGSAEIEDAEISGLFEGDLVVRNRLIIYSTGKVRGKITYGEIEIERGGELTGEINTGTSAASDKNNKSKAA